jgi:hypothetical protein
LGQRARGTSSRRSGEAGESRYRLDQLGPLEVRRPSEVVMDLVSSKAEDSF